MAFSSLLFVSLFFAVIMLVYHRIIGIDKKNIALLVGSLVFYVWGGSRYVAVVVLMSLVTWWFGLLLAQKRQKKQTKKMYLTAGIVLQVGILLYFKYAGLLVNTAHAIVNVPKNAVQIVLPVGISVYAFQLISYLVDVYREEAVPKRKYWMVLLYGGLFFQCIAGPIMPYKEMEYELGHRSVKVFEIGRGINRFVIGLVKVAFFANSCGQIAEVLFPVDSTQLAGLPVVGIWLGILMYMFQIYLEFSGYADMAIGLGLMAGFHFKENFDYPFMAKSVTELYLRWNISLRNFFEEYVAEPLKKWRRGSAGKIVCGMIIAVLTGMWYGPYWNLAVWGVFFWIFIHIEKRGFLDKLKRFPKAVGHIYTLAVVYFSCIIFRCTKMSCFAGVLKAMLGINRRGFTSVEVSATLRSNVWFLVLVIIVCTPLLKYLYEWGNQKFGHLKVVRYVYNIFEVAGPSILLIIAMVSLVGNNFYSIFNF